MFEVPKVGEKWRFSMVIEGVIEAEKINSMGACRQIKMNGTWYVIDTEPRSEIISQEQEKLANAPMIEPRRGSIIIFEGNTWPIFRGAGSWYRYADGHAYAWEDIVKMYKSQSFRFLRNGWDEYVVDKSQGE